MSVPFFIFSKANQKNDCDHRHQNEQPGRNPQTIHHGLRHVRITVKNLYSIKKIIHLNIKN